MEASKILATQWEVVKNGDVLAGYNDGHLGEAVAPVDAIISNVIVLTHLPQQCIEVHLLVLNCF